MKKRYSLEVKGEDQTWDVTSGKVAAVGRWVKVTGPCGQYVVMTPDDARQYAHKLSVAASVVDDRSKISDDIQQFDDAVDRIIAGTW